MKTVEELLDEGEKAHNFRVIKHKITEIINYEPTLDNKLSLLTEIGLTSGNESTFKACEEIRSELCDSCGVGTENLPDNQRRQSGSVASGHSGEKVSTVLREGPSNAVKGEDSVRAKLQTALASLNAKKQKTFTFEGTEFSTPLVKSFLKECRKLKDLQIVVSETCMSFTWPNGNAKINSFAVAQTLIAETKAKQELLK